MNTYVISFILKQRGDKTDWLENVLQSGIRPGESITNFQITDLTEYLQENTGNSEQLTEDNRR